MNADLQFALVTFSAVLFVVDPFAAIPIFLAITAHDGVAKRQRAARRAALASFITLSFFALTGGLLFRVLNISLGSFKIAGGVMLFLMALDMMRARPSPTRSTAEEQVEGEAKDDVAIMPLAIPMLSGPGAIATVMVLVSGNRGHPFHALIVFLAIALTCLVTWLTLRSAASAERFLSMTALRVLERVMGLLLAAVAVEFVVGGLRDILPTLRLGA